MTPMIDDLKRALPERERRYVPVAEGAGIELRRTGDGPPRIRMFIPFNSRSVEMFGFTESIAPGAFARTIKNGASAKGNGDIVALWNHDPLWVLGRQANRTLTLQESDKGLDGEVELDPGDAMHQHFAARIERRDVQGSSFGFTAIRDEWSYTKDGESAHRTLLEVKLFDVSPVTFPAYPKSDAEARAAGVGAAAVALARSGMDLGAMASLLARARDGHIPAEAGEELRGWIGKLAEFIPAPGSVEPSVTRDWGSMLDLRCRRMGIGR